jgi:phosphinothricin acetyltransferase
MRRQDWRQVRAIYAEGLATGIASFLQSPPLWRDWNAGHLMTGRSVARASDFSVSGWAALAPVPDT